MRHQLQDIACRVALFFGLLIGPSAASSANAQSMLLPDDVLKSVASAYGSGALDRLRQWQSMMVNDKPLPEGEKSVRTNDFFNRVPWVEDSRLWGEKDYWASPFEMLGRNGGDCEDFSIGKYFTMRELGVGDAKLLITYVRALKLRQAHMVLAYYPRPGAEPLILDNLDGRIRPASRRTDLLPVYSFNGRGLWRGIQQTRGARKGSAKRIAKWRQMLRRLHSDLVG